MASQREIRRRIGSVKNIRQITRAMQFVAASKRFLEAAAERGRAPLHAGHVRVGQAAAIAGALADGGHLGALEVAPQRPEVEFERRRGGLAADAEAPLGRIEAFEQCDRVAVPRPVQVRRQLPQCLERCWHGGHDVELTHGTHPSDVSGGTLAVSPYFHGWADRSRGW